MIAAEQQLLKTFDFISIARQLAVLSPKQLDWGVSGFEVIPFRLKRPFAGFDQEWKIPINRDLELDLPPTSYKHEFHPSTDACGNFDQALVQLTPLFGPGQAGEATNVYEHHWRVGFFTVRVTTWPAELNRNSHNVFQGKNPYLWLSANISIAPDFPFIEPTTAETMRPLFETNVCQSLVYARRNLTPASPTTLAGLSTTAFLIRSQDHTVRVPLDEIQKVNLLRLTPGRYSGSSTLSLETLFLGTHNVNVAIANGPQTGSLDATAQRLARALGKPLSVEEYSDDG